MKRPFITDRFLLSTDAAVELYETYARNEPIIDYHCHLPPGEIAGDVRFENLAQVWLAGDHYKWRLMRANGVAERFCTGDASDREKFQAWAETMPRTPGNPIYHWTHLELKRYFGITKLLNPESAKHIYDTCSQMLKTSEFSARNLMRKMNVKLICTTDDPLDSLEHHQKIKADGFEIKVCPAWRPDKAMAAENVDSLNTWIDKLEQITNIKIKSYDEYLGAIKSRHDHFHENGCRLSDHDLNIVYAESYTNREIAAIFKKIRSHKVLEEIEVLKFKIGDDDRVCIDRS